MPAHPSHWRLNLRISAVLVVALVVGAGLFLGLRPTGAPPKDGGSPCPTFVLPTPIRHLVIVFLENAELPDVMKNGSYMQYLSQQYAFGAQYYGVSASHTSLYEYQYATSGAAAAANVVSVPELLDRVQECWSGYLESMPAPCDTGSSGLYNTTHNPFIYYSYVVSNPNPAYCASHVQNFTAWNASVENGTVPYYSFVVPNLIHDGHGTPTVNGSVAAADNWLRGWLSPLVNSSLFATTAFVITYDDGSTYLGAAGTKGGGHIYLAVVSPYAHRFYSSDVPYNHFNLLTTTEWLLGLIGHTQHNDNWMTDPPMTDLFDFAATYSLTGTVTASGTPVAGAVVSGDGYRVTTDSGGTFLLPLPDGTYQLSAATPAGCGSAPILVTVNGTSTIQNFVLSCPP